MKENSLIWGWGQLEILEKHSWQLMKGSSLKPFYPCFIQTELLSLLLCLGLWPNVFPFQSAMKRKSAHQGLLPNALVMEKVRVLHVGIVGPLSDHSLRAKIRVRGPVQEDPGTEALGATRRTVGSMRGFMGAVMDCDVEGNWEVSNDRSTWYFCLVQCKWLLVFAANNYRQGIFYWSNIHIFAFMKMLVWWTGGGKSCTFHQQVNAYIFALLPLCWSLLS